MNLIDERGYLFGCINVVDAFVFLLLFGAVAGGVNAVVGGDASPATTQQIVVQTEPQPDFVVASIQNGSVPTDSVVSVQKLGTARQTDQGDQLRLRATVVVRVSEAGLPYFDGERLYIGRKLRLDLGSTIVNGTVIETEPVETGGGERDTR